MTTEEVDLNAELEKAHISPLETDLGEYIVQLAGQKPFHLLAPALHFSAREIAELFERERGMPYTEDEEEITAWARTELRKEFLKADVGISGVNFAVAETGTLVIVENEGNALLSTSSPPIHIALMGIEKVVPRLADLPIFLKLLTRSATGQPISSYVHFITGPPSPRRPGRSRGVVSDSPRQWQKRDLEGPLFVTNAALHPLWSLPECLSRVPDHRGACLWIALSGTHWCHPDPAIAQF